MAQRISRAKQSIKTSGVPFGLPTPEERAQRLARRAARAVSDLQRRLHEQRRAEPAPHRALGRGDPADARRASAAAGRRRSRRAARADAAHRRAARGAHRSRRRADSARRNRIDRCGIEPPSTRASRSISATLSKGSVGAYQLQAAIAAVHDEAAARRGHGLAADPRAVRRARADVRQPDGDAQPRDRGGDGARALVRSGIARRARRRRDGSRAIIASTPSAPTCSNCRATIAGAIAHYRAAAERTASIPERNYLMTQAARLSETPH